MDKEKLEQTDIVYFVKEGALSEELKYSMRTLKNLPHRNIWIYGQKPAWAQNVSHMYVAQLGTKWQNTAMMMEKVIENPEISDKFIVMNDDFFILEPVEKLVTYCDRTLEERAGECLLRRRWGFEKPQYSRYGALLKQTNDWLLEHGYTNRNFELHLPMVFEKKKLAKCLGLFPEGGWAARRSLYGNVNKIKAEERGDCKVYNYGAFPTKYTKQFVSTTDRSFRTRSVGVYIKEHFKEKGYYEK